MSDDVVNKSFAVVRVERWNEKHGEILNCGFPPSLVRRSLCSSMISDTCNRERKHEMENVFAACIHDKLLNQIIIKHDINSLLLDESEFNLFMMWSQKNIITCST